MNLLELTEPLFQFICRLNRVARKNAPSDYGAVRAEIREVFTEMSEKSRTEHKLAVQYTKIEPVLICFVDSIIAQSRLPYASEWDANRLAYELPEPELSGDERFFELLEGTMNERGEDAAERLTIFYTCLGLGFTGMHTGEPELIKRKMTDLALRIRSFVESDDAVRICPAAYDNVRTDVWTRPVGTRVLGIVLVFAGLTLVVIITNIYLFRQSTRDLFGALADVSANDPAAHKQR